MTQDITSLIEKLEGAEVGSYGLDGLVLEATGHKYHLDFGSAWYARPGHNERIYGNGPARVTTSLDAALALAERVVPGTSPGVSKNVFHGYWSAWLHQNVDGACHVVGDASTSTTPALALCAAILRAQSEAR